MIPRSSTTARFVAFLRAINVGGRRVTMQRLREPFESLGLLNVETFIASGNVVFDAPAGAEPTLETEIESHLHDVLGYEVATFVRSTAEVADAARYRPFAASELDAGGNALYVAFLKAQPDGEARSALMACRTEIDDFHVRERAVYWLCRRSVGESGFSGARLERTLGMPATVRNATTISRLAAKYPAAP